VGRRGPVPNSKRKRKLAGNPGRRIAKSGPPALALPPGVPDCPEWLDALARAEWQRIVPALEAAGKLTLGDRAVLTCYCKSWSDYVIAHEILTKEGRTFTTAEKGYICPHPAVAQAAQAAQRLYQLARELGFTPLARLRMGEDPDGPEKPDALDEFLRATN
jgi:P27 family predicted phage terminase small subunit